MSNHVLYDRVWESRKLAAISRDAAFAYLWIYLVADDWGRFEYLPRVIWAKCFGAREDIKAKEVQGWLEEYERVGLMEIYEAGGKKIATWVKFVGPPPSRRRASLFLSKDGATDPEGVRAKSRFNAGTGPVQGCSPEAGSWKLEAGTGKTDGTGRPGSQPAAGHDLPALKARALELAQEIGRREGIAPAAVILAESRTSGGKVIDKLESIGSAPWITTTIAKLEARLRSLGPEPPPPPEPLPPEEPEALAAWGRVLDHIAGDMNSHTFATWFRPTRGHRVDGNELVVTVPSQQFVEWLTRNYQAVIHQAMDTVGLKGVGFRLLAVPP